MVMADNKSESKETSLPIAGMLLLSITGAIVVAISFAVVPYWPLPQGNEPYFGWETGAVWGAVVGAGMGLVLGFLTDDKHFEDAGR